MGVMLLTSCLLPTSTPPPRPWSRKMATRRIAAAGMIVELVVAAFAMLIWLKRSPALVRSVRL